jgi:hypothetical protein
VGVNKKGHLEVAFIKYFFPIYLNNLKISSPNA